MNTLSKKTLKTSLYGAQRRTFVVSAAMTMLGSILFSESNTLANKMENGQLHYKNSNQHLALEEDKPFFTRSKPNYPGHVPLYGFEKVMMAAGSSIGSYFHPERNEFIVALGESTAFTPVLRKLQHQMLSDPIGRKILRERPRITSDSLNLTYLRALPDNTIGKTYINWLDREGVSPDTRVAVRYVDDEELAYIYQRYRECHDFYHAITGLPIIIEGEISIKVFEFMNIGIPMSGLGALMAPWRLKPKQRARLFDIYYPWAIKNGSSCSPLINVYWEHLLERDVAEFREELGLESPPDLRDLRKKQRKVKKQ